MPRLLTAMCFDLDSLDGKILAEVIARGVGFEPTSFGTDAFRRGGGRFSAKAHLPKLAAGKDVTHLALETEAGFGGDHFHLATIGVWGFQVLYWCLDSYGQPDLALVEDLTAHKGFNAAYMCDNEDVFWQSTELLNTYEGFGRSHEGLPKVPDETFGGLKVDIRGNPGARSPFPGMWLQSAWRMWFAGRAFDYLPKERLLEFEGAEVVRALPSGAVFIQLYQDPGACAEPESRAVQRAFRDWMGMAHLAAHASEYGRELSDVALEIETGAFDHGGVRLIRTWLDAKGDPIRRSRAVMCELRELGEDGELLWSERRDVQGR